MSAAAWSRVALCAQPAVACPLLADGPLHRCTAVSALIQDAPPLCSVRLRRAPCAPPSWMRAAAASNPPLIRLQTLAAEG